MKSKLCRICCKNEAISYIFCKTNDLCTKIMYCCPKVDIKEKDGLPSFVCNACEYELDVCYKFVLKCESADKYLRSQPYELCSDDFYPIDVIEIKQQNENEQSFVDKLSDDMPLAQVIQEYKGFQPESPNFQIKNIELQVIENGKPKPKQPRTVKTKTGYKSSVHKCSVCARECINQSALATHMRAHSNYYPFLCSMCDKKYKDNGNLKRHISKHHSDVQRERTFMCECCGKGFYRQADVKVHMRTHTKETPYACNECSAKFTQLGPLIRHKKRHTGEKNHLCSICPKRFCTKQELQMHLVVHTSEKKYKCSICDTTFKHQSNFCKHKKRHLEYRIFICNYCNRNFKFKGNLKLHIERCHSEKSGYCELCGRHATNIEMHMWRHNGKRPFKCDLCSSSFYELRSLGHHINFKHTMTDRFECDVKGCAMKFPSRPMLDVHIAKEHSTEMPFPCDKCVRAFYRKSDLSRHKIGTHKEKFECKKSVIS